MNYEYDGMDESHRRMEEELNRKPPTVKAIIAASGVDPKKEPAPSVFNDPLFQAAVAMTKQHQAWLMDSNNEAVRDPVRGLRDPFMPSDFIR